MSNTEGLMGTRPAQLNVFSPLQSYWPSSPPRSSSKYASPPLTSANNVTPHARFLKLKIVTWNMHDSLPKGDLEELLGKVPSYNPSNSSGDQFPVLSDDGNHPFHLIVVAGQECPTLSGIPKGLGAGFKWHDKEKDKDKDKDKDKGKDKDKEKDRDSKERSEKVKDKDVERSKSRRENEGPKRKKEEESTQDNPAGWTAMCEEWLCNGGCFSQRNVSPTVADVSAPKPLIRRVPSREPKKGPYQLLVKERLMGIYMAIYIHRDMRNLVKGTSKSAVTAGLIGGRVGNKGGVGVSLNLQGTSFLFLNAHLAAHGSRVNHRLANLSKIKAELTVDSYLGPDDPRIMAEDLTDRFDYTFICGDLNFRLDVTRLHADWLITQKDYAQALHFDQLKKLMKDGKAFVGFEEGPINFPPTFKYDVLRTLKKPKRSASRRSQSPQAESPVYTSQEYLVRDTVEEDRDEDVISIASTMSRSSSLNSGDEQGETPDIAATPVTPVGLGLLPSKAAHKARKRWLSLLSTRLSPYKSSKSSLEVSPVANSVRKSLEDTQRFDKPKPPTPVQRHSFDVSNSRTLQPPTILISSTKTSLNSEDQSLHKGVYDSSHKQRVPSWCDRILWKSTVCPVTEEIELAGDLSSRSKSGFVKRLTKALRRRSRSSSLDSTPPPLTRSSKETSTTPSPTSPTIQSIPFSRFVQPPGSMVLSHSRSHESLQPRRASGPDLRKRQSDGRLKRINSAVTDSPSGNSPLGRTSHRSTDNPYSKRPSSRGLVWGFLPSFLSPSQSPEASVVDLVPPGPRRPRKGDVVCLSYGTLDDQGMRRLEGRSDHRPVVGSYAVYF